MRRWLWTLVLGATGLLFVGIWPQREPPRLGVTEPRLVPVEPRADSGSERRPWRVLAIVVGGTAIETLGGRRAPHRSVARFTPDEKALIRRKHDEFEDWLAETTGGRLRARTDVIEVPGPLTSLSVVRGDPEGQSVEDLAYWAAPADLAPLVRGRFPAGRYQMILAWVKLPRSVRAAAGALTSPVMLLETPFSSHFWMERRTYTADMGFEGISHEFYHQITFWLTRELGYDPDLFPSNHPPNTITVEGVELLPAGETRLRWYTHVLSRIVADSMWDAMIEWQRESSVWDPANLAYVARPIGGASTGTVGDLHRLNDGSLGHDGLRDAATTRPARRQPVEAWFGLEWDEPKEISSVVVHPRLRRTDDTYLARAFVLEYERAGRWRELPGTRRVANEEPKVRFEFSPVMTRRIRIRIFDQAPDPRGSFFRASCLELEAYP